MPRRGVTVFAGICLAAVCGTPAADREFRITAEDRAHWAFQAVAPLPAHDPGTANQLDWFIGEKLAEKGLTMNPPAGRRELFRRACFDLTGLPPSPEEAAAFVADNSPDSYDRLLDRLLASPHYGERWGRHWLDVARFAQSNGYERDAEKLLAWRYRDYVIKAFNDDKPWDRFVMEQLAGDELPDATAESVTATAFMRLGIFDDEPDDRRMAEFDALDDIVSTTGAAFLGLTIGCARCHDHKFDPVPQRDYYSLLAFFRGVRPFENVKPSAAASGFLPLAAPGQAGAAGGEWTLAVRESGPVPPATRILLRGSAASEGAPAEPAFPCILTSERPVLPPTAADARSSGRRLALARWIASPQNPLTARVIVNRVWQHHFGRGIVRTTADFGRSGAPPSHPALLDWLAAEFVSKGWSVKQLHRRIMLSQAYCQSSDAGRLEATTVDPGNDLLWHQNLRRLEAEALRDSILSVAGTLNPAMGGRGFFPHLSGEVLAGQSRPGLDWEVSSETEQSRRSVYAYVRRTMAVPLLEGFDYSNTITPLTERTVTTVAPQALMLLNGSFIHRQAAAFADRLVREAGPDQARLISRAWQLALNREPSPHEAEMAASWLRRQSAAFAALESRLTFRPDVAAALSADYFPKLPPSGFLTGPAQGWDCHRGVWAPAYEGIRVVARERGPFALWQGRGLTDGILRASLTIQGSTELAGLLFRASADGDDSRGYELLIDPRRRQAVLRRNAPQPAVLATADFSITPGVPVPLCIDAAGPRLRVTVGEADTPLMEVTDTAPPPEGDRIGVRAWGGGLWLDHVSIQPEGQPAGELILSGNPPAEIMALRSLGLLLFNLNEFAFID